MRVLLFIYPGYFLVSTLNNATVTVFEILDLLIIMSFDVTYVIWVTDSFRIH